MKRSTRAPRRHLRLDDHQVQVHAGTLEQFALSGQIAPSNSTRSPTFRKSLCTPSAKRKLHARALQQHHLAVVLGEFRERPDASMCATLTRQRNGSPLSGTRSASCVMPPPFFQGVALKDALRMICSWEVCTPVLYRVGGLARPHRAARTATAVAINRCRGAPGSAVGCPDPARSLWRAFPRGATDRDGRRSDDICIHSLPHRNPPAAAAGLRWRGGACPCRPEPLRRRLPAQRW
jgi:hypothetical protein